MCFNMYYVRHHIIISMVLSVLHCTTVGVPIYRPVVARRPKRTGKQGKPVYRGKRPYVHKKSRCISTDFDMACLCFSCSRGSLQLQYY